VDEKERSRLDALLELLADEVAERLASRSEAERVEPATPTALTAVDPPLSQTEVVPMPAPALALAPALDPEPEAEPEPELAVVPGPAMAAISHAAVLMTRLAIGVLLVVVLINIPFNAQGTALARSIPNSASLVIRDGLLVKEAGSEDVWVYHNNAFHWITSLEAFNRNRYRWQDVHIVEDGYLSQFQKGNPLGVLLKCDSSPHVYLLERGSKRWIVDIPTLNAEGYAWEAVQMVPCGELRGLPDGDSIPPGSGTPPPPLP
jgi:hypothetical protein